jgi:hypothetical protein
MSFTDFEISKGLSLLYPEWQSKDIPRIPSSCSIGRNRTFVKGPPLIFPLRLSGIFPYLPLSAIISGKTEGPDDGAAV